MTLYNLALFVHILGAIGLFVAISLTHVGMSQIRRAHSVAQVREWTSLLKEITKLFPVSNLALLLPGIYLTISQWGWGTGWIDLALGSVLVLAVVGPVVTGRRMAAIGQSAATAPDGPVPAPLSTLIHDPVLWTTSQVTLWMALGIVFLMTVKPGWGGSLAVLGVALLIGLLTSVRYWRVRMASPPAQ